MFHKLQKLALTVHFFLISSLAAYAEWDVYKLETGHLDILRIELNTDGEIDQSYVDVEMSGSRVKITVMEVVDDQVVDIDDEKEQLDVDRIIVRGSNSTEIITIHPQVSELVWVDVFGRGSRDVLEGGTQLYGQGGDDLLAYGERMYGGTGEDYLLAGPSTDWIDGGDDNDEIDGSESTKGFTAMGRGGNDLIKGSSFDDYLVGGRGDDDLYGNDGNDVLRGDVSIVGDSTEDDGDDLLVGGAGEDHLVGNGGNDTLSGEGDSDRLEANAGIDILVGGEGNDVLNPGPMEGTEWVFGLAGGDVFVLDGPVGWHVNDYDWMEGDMVD